MPLLHVPEYIDLNGKIEPKSKKDVMLSEGTDKNAFYTAEVLLDACGLTFVGKLDRYLTRGMNALVQIM